MPPLDAVPRDVLIRSAFHFPRAQRRRGFWRLAILALLAVGFLPAAPAWAGKVKLVRKYRAGQVMVYTTEVRTRAQVESQPAELKNFFPPVPPELTMRQQNTVTVTAVHPDGAADIQHRIDRFELLNDLTTIPENMRGAAREAQQEITDRMSGQVLTVHYDHEGKLVGFEGADPILEDLDPPVREPLRQMMRLFLEQMGGQALYPDHPVKEGEEWTQKLDSAPLPDYPFQVHGLNTLHYSGKTSYHGVKAAIVDYHFENTLLPGQKDPRSDSATAQLDAMGTRLTININGKGQGRVLVALDDGRVLQNHSKLHQTLSALMKAKEGLMAAEDQLPKLEIQSDTEMQVEGAGK